MQFKSDPRSIPDLCLQIGVSNCSIPYLEELLKHAKIVPAANQCECHALNAELELADYCKSKG